MWQNWQSSTEVGLVGFLQQYKSSMLRVRDALMNYFFLHTFYCLYYPCPPVLCMDLHILELCLIKGLYWRRNCGKDRQERVRRDHCLSFVALTGHLFKKKNCSTVLHTDTRLKEIFPELPLLSYRQPPSLRKMIVRSALPQTTKAGTFPCNSKRCETCKYILCKDQIAIPNTQKVYTIRDCYSCASSNVVYLIICTKCPTGGMYIGETGQKLRTRMNHHRHKIKTKACDTPVGQHFCNQEHRLQDMKVLILKGNFGSERERKIYEFKCMELFNTLRQGLNLGSGFMSHYLI
ncbi:hypothetical protein XENTR_v10000557 [Xenopus tropicalis]|nr:hypothetical protein XENTR_v10000557 [Xenopus tropicalis]